MLQSLVTVGEQALVLLLLILVGCACGKTKLIPMEAVPYLSTVALYLVIPCTLLSAFQLELTRDTLGGFAVGLLASLVSQAVSFALSILLLRHPDPGQRRVLAAAAAFSNCSFMAFPLQTALLGSSGVFYGSTYAAASALLLWTWGVAHLEGGRGAIRLRTALCNPGIVGVIGGLLVFLLQITFPPILSTVIDDIASMSVPLPMLIIGLQLSQTRLGDVLRDRYNWLTAGLRLVLLPLLSLGGMYLCGVRGDVLIALTVGSCAPPAAIIAMLAERAGKDGRRAAELVSSQTLLSIVTMPLIIALAELLA